MSSTATHGPATAAQVEAADAPTRRTPTSTSAATAHAVAFVAAHKDRALAIGRGLAELVDDPDGFADALRAGFEELADPPYLAGARSVAPGIGPLHGVRWPLTAAVQRGFREATRKDRPAHLLFLADRLYDEPTLEERWFAFELLERVLEVDAERAWQLLRRAARDASDWITIDSLAHPYGRGILAEPYRWAELEQLVYSPSRWERRLVGSTVATMPHLPRRLGSRDQAVADNGLALVGQLIGDDEADVQKALAWALRELVRIDPAATTAFCEEQAEVAQAENDGYRAWVVRDALPKLEPDVAARIRDRLDGVRRRAGSPSTSLAAAAAATFAGPGGLPDPRTLPDAPMSTIPEPRQPWR